MILMSKYKGQHGEKKGQKIRAMPERKHFLQESFPNSNPMQFNASPI